MNQTTRNLLNASREPMPFTPCGISIAVLFGAFAMLMNETQSPSQSADTNRDGTVAHRAVANIGICAATRACAPASRNNAMKIEAIPDVKGPKRNGAADPSRNLHVCPFS